MKIVALGDVADIQSGYAFPLDLQGRNTGQYPFAKVGDISRVGRAGMATLESAAHFVDSSDLARLKAKPVPAGSVLFAKIGEAIRQNHRAIAGRDLLIDNNAMAAIPSACVDSRYLYHYLRTIDFYALASATTVPSLRKSELARLPIPLPAMSEQLRIAGVLDQAETLRAKRREALARLDELQRSVFIEMFGDPVSNSARWRVVPLGELARIIRGASPRPAGDPRYFGGPIPWLKISDVTSTYGRIVTQIREGVTEAGRDRSVYLEPGTLVLTNSATVGIPKFLGIGACIHDGFLAFLDISPRLNADFLYMFLLQVRHHLSSLAPEGTQKNLNTGIAKALRVIVPPIDLQERFTRTLVSIEALATQHIKALGGTEALFASLQHRAFRGEL